MREIKFRGKVKYNGNHKFSGDWIYGYYRNNDNGNAFITETLDEFDNYIFEEIEVDENTVEQYTGLKDKNGKEIYEGDIFEIKYNKKDFMVWVEYSEKYAQFITRCEENILNDEPLGDLTEKHIEVIGNIYDNPELIKED